MKHPCENCIVDPICIEACPNFKDYISKVFVSDFNSIFTYTSARSKRIYNLAKNNVEYFIYFSSLLKRKDMEEKRMEYPCKTCIVDPICRDSCELLLSYLKSIDRNPEGEISQQVVLTRNRSERAIECASYGTISSDLYCSIVLAISSLMLSLQPIPKSSK